MHEIVSKSTEGESQFVFIANKQPWPLVEKSPFCFQWLSAVVVWTDCESSSNTLWKSCNDNFYLWNTSSPYAYKDEFPVTNITLCKYVCTYITCVIVCIHTSRKFYPSRRQTFYETFHMKFLQHSRMFFSKQNTALFWLSTLFTCW